MPKLRTVLLCCIIVTLLLTNCSKKDNNNNTITLTYWRHHYATEDKAVKFLIKKFESKNPGIKIHYQSMPYKGYREKLDTSLYAGEGPDVINIHNSWVYPFLMGRRIIRIPDDKLPSSEMEKDYIPLISSFALKRTYYGLPIGGGCLGLFINTDHLESAALKPTAYPKDWDELEELALQLTIRLKGKLARPGFACGGIKSQSWNYLVEGLFRQNGAEIIKDSGSKVLWNTSEGVEAFTWYTDFVTKHKIFNLHFVDKPVTLFIGGTASMIVDLNSVTAKIKEQAPNLKYAVYPLPSEKQKATYGSAWGNCITSSCSEEKQEAAFKFINFLASEYSAKFWTDQTGELPLQRKILNDPEFRKKHSALLPFIESMEYAYSSLKKDETAYKTAITKAIEKVIIKGVSPKAALNEAAETVNEMLGKR